MLILALEIHSGFPTAESNFLSVAQPESTANWKQPGPTPPWSLSELRSRCWEKCRLLLCFHTVLVDNCLNLCVPLPHFIIVVSGGIFNDFSSISAFFLLICFFSPAWHTQYADFHATESQRFITASYLTGNRCSLQKPASHHCIQNNYSSKGGLPTAGEYFWL